MSELDSKKLRFQLDHPGLAPDDPASIETELAALRHRLSEANLTMSVTKEKRGRLQEWVQTQSEFIENPRKGKTLS